MLRLTNNDTELAIPIGPGGIICSRLAEGTYRFAYGALGASSVSHCDAAGMAVLLRERGIGAESNLLTTLGWTDVLEQCAILAAASPPPAPRIETVRRELQSLEAFYQAHKDHDY